MARGRKSEYVIDATVDTTKLTSGIASVVSEFGDLEEKGKEAFEGVTDKAGSFISKLGGSEDTVSKFGDIGSKAFGGIDKALGGLPSGFAGALKGIKGANGGFKAMKGAIASTGVGLLVIALGELIAYLMNSKTFIDVMNTAMMRVKATIQPTVDLIMKLGKALSALFSGNPGEAFDIASEAVGGYGGALADAQRNVTDMNKAQRELNKLMKDMGRQTAMNNIEEYEYAKIAKDRSKSDADRLTAMRQLSMTQMESLRLQKKANDLEYSNLIRLSKIQSLDEDQKKRIQELKVIDLEQFIEEAEIRDELEEFRNDIEEDRVDREEDARQDRQDAIDDQKEKDAEILESKQELLADLEYLRKSEKAQELFDAKELYDERVAIAGDDEGLLKSALEQYNIDKKAIEDEFQAQADADQQVIDDEKARKTAELDNALKSQEQLEIDRATNQYNALYALAVEAGYGMEQLEDEQKKRLEDITKKYLVKDKVLHGQSNKDKYDITVSAMNALIGLSRAISEDSEENAERRFNVDKALGIGIATINTAIAISDALAKDSVTPFSRYASAITAGAMGLAQVVAIKSTTFEGGGSLDDASDSGGGGGGQSVINEAPQLDLDFLGGGAGQAGVQAYVVSSQMSSSQQAQQQIQDQASLVS
jgi:hypothetical protein